MLKMIALFLWIPTKFVKKIVVSACKVMGVSAFPRPYFFFSRTFFRLPSSPCRRCLPGPTAAPSRALAGPLAAANRRELPAHVREDFVQLRRLTGNVALPSQREFQQRRGDGALCSDSEQP